MPRSRAGRGSIILGCGRGAAGGTGGALGFGDGSGVGEGDSFLLGSDGSNTLSHTFISGPIAVSVWGWCVSCGCELLVGQRLRCQLGY